MSVSPCLLLLTAALHLGESNQCKNFIKKNGILGKSVLLYEFEMRAEYKMLSLKYTKDATKMKLLVYDLESDNHKLPNSSTSRFQFEKVNPSVVIHKLRKDDEKEYELMLERETEDDFSCIELKVYEEISNLTVSVTEDSENNTCKVTMRCLMQTGENVTFSWTQDEKNLSHDSSTLEIRITNDNANSTFRCTAKNPVSEQSTKHRLSSACTPDTDKSLLGLILSILTATIIVLVLLIVVIIAVIKRPCNNGMYRKRCVSPQSSDQSRPPAPDPVEEQEQEAIRTLYAGVQKPKNQSVYLSAPRSPPFSSVYELAGPCGDGPHLQNITETRKNEPSADSSTGEPKSLTKPTFSLHC